MNFFEEKITIFDNLKGYKVKDMSQVQLFLNYDKNNKCLSYEGLNLNSIQNSFRISFEVFFVDNFPIELISKRRQGWTREGIINLINSLLNYYNIRKISSLEEFNELKIDDKIRMEIKNHIPPIIVTLLPDESFHLEDGNHRIALSELFFHVKELKAFVIKGY
ncbi:MAG: hypothetical protein KC589_04640 [Nanoarchaeota archaeon]|nr:hypothetical protein [Nanoarchaeota archaeon]